MGYPCIDNRSSTEPEGEFIRRARLLPREQVAVGLAIIRMTTRSAQRLGAFCRDAAGADGSQGGTIAAMDKLEASNRLKRASRILSPPAREIATVFQNGSLQYWFGRALRFFDMSSKGGYRAGWGLNSRGCDRSGCCRTKSHRHPDECEESAVVTETAIALRIMTSCRSYSVRTAGGLSVRYLPPSVTHLTLAAKHGLIK